MYVPLNVKMYSTYCAVCTAGRVAVRLPAAGGVGSARGDAHSCGLAVVEADRWGGREMQW